MEPLHMNKIQSSAKYIQKILNTVHSERNKQTNTSSLSKKIIKIQAIRKQK